MRLIDIQGMATDEIIGQLSEISPNVSAKVEFIRSHLEHYNKREIWFYQAALLFVCAEQYNNANSEIMEFGTCWGWSAAVMAGAAPTARIVTMTPNPNHFKISSGQLAQFRNVKVLDCKSSDLLAQYTGPKLDMLFVDGDHDNVHLDLPWWNWLKVGGLMLHHDYTPKGAPARPTPVVYRWLNRFADRIGRKPDVLVIDNQLVGMAGWYKRKDDLEWVAND